MKVERGEERAKNGPSSSALPMAGKLRYGRIRVIKDCGVDREWHSFDTSDCSRRGILRRGIMVPRKPQNSKAESGATMRAELLRFDGAVERDPRIDAWMKKHAGELRAIAREWFEVMRKCGDEVRELLHDGCPVACLGDAPFGYVNVFRSHVNAGFFHGAALPDPARLLQGAGKSMRHVKLRPRTAVNDAALRSLIEAAYSDIKARVEHG
jgi:hypothetical protein